MILPTWHWYRVAQDEVSRDTRVILGHSVIFLKEDPAASVKPRTEIEMTNSSQSCLIGCKWSLLILFLTVIIWITEEARCSSWLGNINHPNGKFYPWIIITPFDDTYGHISAGWSYLIRVMNFQLIYDIISVTRAESDSVTMLGQEFSSNITSICH